MTELSVTWSLMNKTALSAIEMYSAYYVLFWRDHVTRSSVLHWRDDVIPLDVPPPYRHQTAVDHLTSVTVLYLPPPSTAL